MKHDDTVYSAQFSPNGQRVVTASSDETARVWGVLTITSKDRAEDANLLVVWLKLLLVSLHRLLDELKF
jgi:WD40 repeat protein